MLIELVSPFRRSDLTLVHHARASAVPARVHGTKRAVPADIVLCGRGPIDVLSRCYE